MTNNWDSVPLSEVATIGPKEPALPTEAPFIEMKDVPEWGEWATSSSVRGSRGGVRARGGDVLMARITPCLENGKIAKVPEHLGAVGGSTEFIVIRARERVLPEFLFYWAVSASTHQQAVALMTGSTGRQRVSSVDVGAIRIALPPLDVQRRIAHLLSGYDNHIAATKREATAAQAALNAIQNDLLWGDDQRERQPLGDIADIQVGFAFKSAGFTEDTSDVRLLRGDNITPGRLRWKGAKHWPVSDVEPHEQYRLAEGDAVVAMDRTWISSGLKVAVIREDDLPCLLVQRVARLRAKPGVDQRLLEFLLSSDAFRSLVLNEQTGTAVPHISGGQIAAFPVWVPSSTDEQRRVADALVAQREHCENLEREMKLAQEARNSLLTSLLSNRLAIPESYDRLLEEVA